MDFTKGWHYKRGSIEMWICRRMLKISWTEHVTNDNVLEVTEEQKTLMTTLRQRRQRMVGTCVTPRPTTKESNWRANERKKEAWQDKENAIRLVGEKKNKNRLFTAKEDDRRQNWMALINTRPPHSRIPVEEERLLADTDKCFSSDSACWRVACVARLACVNGQ